MALEIKIPNVGESVQEAVLAEWYKKDGDFVEKDEPLFVIETDKVTLEVPAEASGTLHITVAEGETVPIGAVVGTIDTEAEAGSKEESGEKKPAAETAPKEKKETEKASAKDEPEKKEASEKKDAAEKAPSEKPAAQPPPSESSAPETTAASAESQPLLPSVRRLISEKGIDPGRITGTGPGGRITKGDVLLYLESGAHDSARENAAPSGEGKKTAPKAAAGGEGASEDAVTVKSMTPIRKRIAEHLLAAKQSTAMLTTFNEIDMSRVMEIRNRFKDAFHEQYQVRLGFMSFFIKAVVAALKESPDMNARLDGDKIVYQHFYHIGVAIGAERGLVVPVIKNADRLSFADLESAIIDFVNKIKENRLQLEELEGGTFSITNGGVYGSLLSTPILNMPQSGILGMHKIEERPVVVDGQIVIRPMMYVALSYDHRIVDGKTAVTVLRRIKEFVENPERIMMEI